MHWASSRANQREISTQGADLGRNPLGVIQAVGMSNSDEIMAPRPRAKSSGRRPGGGDVELGRNRGDTDLGRRHEELREIETGWQEKKKTIHFHNQCHLGNYCEVGIVKIYKI
jgi:hypothetical protein